MDTYSELQKMLNDWMNPKFKVKTQKSTITLEGYDDDEADISVDSVEIDVLNYELIIGAESLMSKDSYDKYFENGFEIFLKKLVAIENNALVRIKIDIDRHLTNIYFDEITRVNYKLTKDGGNFTNYHGDFWTNRKYDYEQYNHVISFLPKYSLGIYFNGLQLMLNELKTYLAGYKVEAVEANVAKEKTIKSIEDNWIGHSKNYNHNIAVLKLGLKDFMDPKDIKSFYDLLNSNKTDKAILWNGQVNQLVALIDGIAKNSAFQKTNRKYAYFTDKLYYINEKGVKVSSSSKFNKNSYDPDDIAFKKLYSIGRELK